MALADRDYMRPKKGARRGRRRKYNQARRSLGVWARRLALIGFGAFLTLLVQAFWPGLTDRLSETIKSSFESLQEEALAQNPTKTLHGKVVSIADGDTVTLLDSSNRQHKVRLTEIDTPERGQPWGTKARQALADKIFRKEVTVKTEA